VLVRSASRTEAEIAVEAGKRAELPIDMNAGILKARPEVAGGSPSWEVHEAEADIEGKRKRVAYSYDAEPEWTLTAGRYIVSYKSGARTASAEVEVGAGGREEFVVRSE
jgi:hypothetical protein